MALPELFAFLQGVPLLHVGGKQPTGPYYTHWVLEPSIAIGVFALAVLYLAALGPINRRYPGFEERTASRAQIASFLGGCLTILIALGPPLDDWSDYFLLTAHMVEHLLLTTLAAPLLVYGTPGWMLRPLLRWRVVAKAGYILTRPLIAFLVPSLVFAVWHLPALYDAALRSNQVHIFEHVCFLVTALLMWWPVFGNLPEWPKLSRPLQCIYLFALSIPMSIVGALITFAPPGLYEPYTLAPRIFGLSLSDDQQIAGLLMWVVTGTVFLAQVTYVFFQWAGQEERAQQEQEAAERAAAMANRPHPV